MKIQEWYTIVHSGTDPAPAYGPFKGQEKAQEALERFRGRQGYLAGTYEAAGNVRVVGPYSTRARARRADISSY